MTTDQSGASASPDYGLSGAELAKRYGLRQVGGRPPLRQYLREAWARRHFAISLAKARAYSGNQENYLGQLWTLLTPLMWTGLYLLIFGVIMDTSRGVDNFVGFLVCGMFLFRFVAGSITGGVKVMRSNKGLIGSLKFPRVLVPISAVIRDFITLIPEMVILLIICYLTGEPIRLENLMLIPALGLMFCFATGIILITARIGFAVEDLANLLPFISRALIYTSGVFFSIEHFAGQGLLGTLMAYQPVALYLELGRSCLLEGTPMQLHVWLLSAAWAIVMPIIGLIFFWRAEETYGRK